MELFVRGFDVNCPNDCKVNGSCSIGQTVNIFDRQQMFQSLEG
jgi:hypothetical protein